MADEAAPLADTVAPIFRQSDRFFLCGWCGTNLDEEWIEAHRELHQKRLERCAQLAQYDGYGSDEPT